MVSDSYHGHFRQCSHSGNITTVSVSRLWDMSALEAVKKAGAALAGSVVALMMAESKAAVFAEEGGYAALCTFGRK